MKTKETKRKKKRKQNTFCEKNQNISPSHWVRFHQIRLHKVATGVLLRFGRTLRICEIQMHAWCFSIHMEMLIRFVQRTYARPNSLRVPMECLCQHWCSGEFSCKCTSEYGTLSMVEVFTAFSIIHSRRNTSFYIWLYQQRTTCHSLATISVFFVFSLASSTILNPLSRGSCSLCRIICEEIDTFYVHHSPIRFNDNS